MKKGIMTALALTAALTAGAQGTAEDWNGRTTARTR